MSKITTIMADMVTFLDATLPNHKRLPNGYDLRENPEPYLVKGWGLAIQAGTNTHRQLSCNLSVGRSLIVSLTRKYFGNDAATDTRHLAEIALLEDQYLVIKEIEKATTPFTLAIKSGWESDSGIEFAYSSEEKPFYALRMTFDIEYTEDLN